MTERAVLAEKADLPPVPKPPQAPPAPLVVTQQTRIEEIKNPSPEVFFSSGAVLLDLVLGGGWAMGRIFNIVGDKSVGKTLLAIEAFANFKLKFPKGRMRYAEAEAALDETFAAQLGFPTEVTRPEELLNTVEDFRDDFDDFIKEPGPSLYILDSLDALSDDAELEKFEKKSDAGSYGTGKAKGMSGFFRLLTRKVKQQNSCLGIISQIRENIGVSFGEQYGRSGGKALDFYATHALWLHNAGKEEKTFESDTRAVGNKIIAKCKKNKVGLPFRECAFSIMFGYGTDSDMACLDWLIKEKKMADEAGKALKKQLKKARETQDFKTIDEISLHLKEDTVREWKRIEDALKFPIKKYR